MFFGGIFEEEEERGLPSVIPSFETQCPIFVDASKDKPAVRLLLNDAWKIVPATGNSPISRSLHVSALVDSRLYVTGGYDGVDRINDMHIFDFNTSHWTEIYFPLNIMVPSVRDRHAAVAHGKMIYLFGGYDGSGRVNDFWVFNTVTQEWAPIMHSRGEPPSPRHSHAAAVCGDSIYLFGGFDGNYRNDFHVFNIHDYSWNEFCCARGTTPKPRYRTSMVVWKSTIIVFGGHDGSRHLNDLFQFDCDERTWTKIEFHATVPPTPRDSHVAVVDADCMYIFGGSTGQAQNELFEYNICTQEWSLFPGATAEEIADSNYQLLEYAGYRRFCHTGVVYNSSFYVFGGYDGQRRLNDFIQYRLPGGDPNPARSLPSDLKQFVNSDQYSDVSFLVEDHVVKAHKLMCSRCNYFRAMFQIPMKESTQNDPVEIVGVPRDIFLALLEYLYTDEVSISLESAMPLFVAADLFGVYRLKVLCQKKLLTSITTDNAALMLQAADTHSASYFRQHCIDFVVRNFDAVSKTKSFESMARTNVEILLEIIHRR